MYLPFISLAVVLATTSKVAATGINCDGSGLCGPKVATQLVSDILTMSDSTWVNNGQHIACEGDICAFLQNTGGAPGSNIKGLAHFITEHGCESCGSVPYFYPSDNNVADGELTFNAVSNPTCNGLCV
ncbi:killer toxin [Mycena latifolia]|nr:killer toxin [Mycena latifolia]KAJ7478408.1 killer toxin [Mycena latifolia]